MNDMIIADLVIGVGWIWGFACLFEGGYLLYPVGEWLRDHLPKWACDPLFDCQMCMASVHGTLIFFTFINSHLVWWPVYCVCLCGLNYIIHSTHVALQKKD